ncbi:hypothetical protein [Xenorhabdus szentirmaii]|nr:MULTISPECIES: hypothetical protein [unclassified Xenorhabdus]MBD2779521.1 hypothetical protein [Xenorhabdus sp. 38]MBD2790953.1 hypothetical protein [Xenorhabdus sp. CUL]MBD2801236.1 hypothetical protein [Xenorhabdus sp. M]MBD2803989.1 hypothetical protein [Xenorhabdus sp. ZM]MBD2825173.1 hypothetical protein [Xenorhabdus sp. 5]
MDKYDATNDHYCYQGSSTLINKLGIKNIDDLESAERKVTVLTIQNNLL